MATDDDRRRIALQNECLLNKYAQRQLKALELDLKCAHAKSLHQTRRRNSHNACDPPSTTLSSNLPATVASSSSSSSSLVLSTIDMNTFSIEPADYTDRSATITSSTDAEDEFGDFQANADIQSDSTTTLMHMMLTNSSVLDQATRPDLLGLPNEFGRFQSHSTDHQLDLWTRLMTCIRRTLTRCCDLLLTSKMPLPSIRQALATPRGCNFCLGILVYFDFILLIRIIF